MKHTKKTLGTMLLSVAFLTSCADMDPLGFNAFEKPASIEGMEYLADYDALKEYKSLNSSVSPDFKLGMALSANDYNANGMWTRLANANFDEVVAGNEMKMASIVNDQGQMDFGTVSAFVNNAETNGMNVYGHTLAWHAQQPKKWLEKLIKDKELDIDPDAKIETLISVNSFEEMSDQPFPYYAMGCEPPIVNGAMHYEANGGWNQFFIFPAGNGNTLSEGDYLIRLYMKASNDADGLQLTIQNGWSNAQQININFSAKEGEQVYELQCPGVLADPSTGYDVILKPQTANVNLDVRKVEFYKLESPAIEVEQEVSFYTYEDKPDGPFPHYPMGCEPPIVNGALHFVPTGGWSQFFVVPASDNKLEEGDFVFYVDMASDKDASGVQLTIQNGWSGAQSITASIPVKAGRHTYALKFPEVTANPSANYDCILKPQTADATLDFYSLKACVVKKMNSIPLTPEEKKDTLTWAMDQWVAGMMEACDGKVKAWDVVNEAISGGDPDAEGVYALQHDPDGAKPNDFYWQDYLGDLDYVRTVVKFARQYGPEDIKLFVNDYNLESDWDDNQKLKSLIAWIKRWEADGVTKIDGIGTQMHLSYYSNPDIQASKEKHIVEMFKLMANSGKLVRVSELDIEFKDEQGNNVKVEDMTDAQLRKVSDFYKWIIQQYIANVPAAQQYGFCIWTAIDADPSTSWTHNQLYGLWNKNFNRTHAYAGFADGLGGK